MQATHINRLRLAPGVLVTHRGFAVLSAGRTGFIVSSRHGFFLHQTRFLSRFEIKAEDLNPVSANAVEPHAAIAYLLLPSPAGAAGGPPGDHDSSDGGEIVHKGIEFRQNTYVGGGLHCELTITNHTLADAEITFDLAIEADFADMDEVTAGKRQQDAPVERRWTPKGPGEGTLELTYTHPELNHATRVEIAGRGEIADRAPDLRFTFALKPRVPETVRIDIVPVFQGEAHRPWYGSGGEPVGFDAPRLEREWQDMCASVENAPPMVQNAWDRAVGDLASLHMLDGSGAERWVPIAGVPKYSALFGRDTLVAGVQTTMLNPATLEGSLRRVGRWTAKTYDERYDAQPGKVLHQHQLSPLALLGVNPYRHYYGDYSAPGLFVLGAALHFAQTADREVFEAIRSEVEATLAWMDRDGDIDGDGFYEYLTRAGKKGTKNQGWKDSGEAILYADGAMVEDPIAVVEVQGLYYAAKQAIAQVYRFIGQQGRASELSAEASQLKARFNERFWLPAENYYALALDPEKRPVATIASDPGACLAYGIVDLDKAKAVADRLLRPDLFSGWGIRTLSADHPAYNPLAYHLGTVWPMPNATICFGLWRYGFDEACLTVAHAQFESTQIFDFDRLPEVFGGHPRDREHLHPGIYPGACSPQAWSAGAVVQNVQTLFGLTPVAPLDALIVDPILPDWLPAITLRGFQLGRRRLTLRFERDSAGRSHCELLEGGDGVRVFRPPPRQPGAAPADRLARALDDLAAA